MTVALRPESPAPAAAVGRPVRAWLPGRPSDVVDVFVYVVVLNLAIEYLPGVISEGFTLSLLTAVLLKVALEVVIRVKNRILARLRLATTRRTKVLTALSLWVVAVGSKDRRGSSERTWCSRRRPQRFKPRPTGISCRWPTGDR